MTRAAAVGFRRVESEEVRLEVDHFSAQSYRG
jgi:hypothetical protein